jgi:hypothetical protein
MEVKQNNTNNTIGYILFGISICMWLAPTVIGFLHLTPKETAYWITAVIIIGEVFFVISILLLGKVFLRKFKYVLKKIWLKILFKLGKSK